MQLGITLQLSDAMISKLARKISVQNLSAIAIETLGFSIDELKNLKAGYREDVYLINMDILCAWRKKMGKIADRYFFSVNAQNLPSLFVLSVNRFP